MPMNPIQKRADQVRAVALESVLRLTGAQPDLHDRHKWHIQEEVLSVTGSKFMNWNRGLGGGGAIDLVIHLHHRGFMEALEWLEHHFPNGASMPFHEPRRKLSLQLPDVHVQNLWRIQGYLINERSIPPALVEKLIGWGQLYADAKANAVFLLLGQNNNPVGAELRGTTHHSWRGMAPGSQKDQGCFAIGSASDNDIILCESAIDAISCSALHSGSRCLSTAGARPNPQWLPSMINQGFNTYCGFDADPVGDAMAQAMIHLHPSIKRLRPSKKDWNDLLKSRS